VFPTLASYVDAVRCSLSDCCDLRSFHPDGGILIANQDGLHRFIAELYDGAEGDGVDVLLALIPSLNLYDLALLQRMASGSDFYEQTVAHGAAGRASSEINVVRRGPVNVAVGAVEFSVLSSATGFVGIVGPLRPRVACVMPCCQRIIRQRAHGAVAAWWFSAVEYSGCSHTSGPSVLSQLGVRFRTRRACSIRSIREFSFGRR
jgi:hypothetical protein